jgi:uncharacterized protein YkwD
VTLWQAIVYAALALLVAASFYVLLRWRRSPLAVRGMAVIAGLCFLSGLLIGIWISHLVSETTGVSETIGQVAATPVKASPSAPPTRSKQSPRATPSLAATMTPTPQPTPASTPSVAAKEIGPGRISSTDWLGRVNFYRSLAKLPPVVEDPALSSADILHARYLVKNHLPPDSRMHNEERSNVWFTPEGLAAARASDVVAPCAGCVQLSPVQAIDMWIGGPFHRLSILNRGLSHVGYGEFREVGLKAHVISVGGAWPRPGAFSLPIKFPADGTIVALNGFTGEWPDPLASCAGFHAPSGLAVTLELGANVATVVEQHRFTEDGRALAHCVFDASTYANPVASAQQWGRNTLKGFGAVVLIPRSPLVPGHRYTVDLIVSGRRYGWSFSVEQQINAWTLPQKAENAR